MSEFIDSLRPLTRQWTTRSLRPYVEFIDYVDDRRLCVQNVIVVRKAA
jgi:hypothetical protein